MGSSLAKRLLTAAVGIPILFFTIKAGPAWLTLALVSLCAALGAREACLLVTTPDRRPVSAVAMAGAVGLGIPFLFPPTAWHSASLPMAVFIGLLAAVLLACAALRTELRAKLEASIGTLFAAVYVGLPLGFLTGLRTMDDEEMGRDLIVLLLVVIWVGDTAAMYAGSLVGRHRLAPRISPKKSIEGAVAGVLGGIGGALLAHVWWFHRLPVLHAVVIGVVLGVVGIAGDLSESILKRAAGAKDSSAILPGHGGILDRIDSLLFAGPALYYYYLLFLRHP